jgi:chitin synthase
MNTSKAEETKAKSSAFSKIGSNKELVNPSNSISSEEEMSAWRKYQSRKVGYPNILSLSELDQKTVFKADSVAENLKERWKEGLTFTSIGHEMLISVNNNDLAARRKDREKEIRKNNKDFQADKDNTTSAIYTEDETFLLLLEDERNMLINDPRGNHIVQDHNHAHIFSYAARCYWHMLREQDDQVVFFRGETGSGKSYTAKMFLLQLLFLSNQYSRKIESAAKFGSIPPVDYRLTKKIMAATQLVELFSSAQTPLSPISSRIHKYTEIQFNDCGKIVGAKFIHLMLEKSRTAQAFNFSKHERNFNIFYALFAPGQLSREERQQYHFLDSARSYNYLIPNDTSSKFKRTFSSDDLPPPISIKQVFTHLGLSKKIQGEILKLLSALLLLGNVEFAIYEAKKEEGVYIKSVDILEKCSLLLGVSAEALEVTLTQKTSSAGSTLCVDYLALEEAKQTRDHFVVTVYEILFEYLMTYVNRKLNVAREDNSKSAKWENWIGIMDFAGFENMSSIAKDPVSTTHRYWQFMTNFIDEKILSWNHINVLGLSTMKEYDAGDIEKIILETDDMLKSTLNMFQHPQKGILTILDNECLISGDSDYQALSLAELFKRANKPTKNRKSIFSMSFSETSENIYSPFLSGISKGCFGVKHYSGYSQGNASAPSSLRVYYDTSDFLEENLFGGRYKGPEQIKSDYMRLIKGTADFTSSKNKFLVTILEQKIHTSGIPSTQFSDKSQKHSVKIIEETPKSPSIRAGEEDRKLSSILAEKLNDSQQPSPLYKEVLNSQLKGDVDAATTNEKDENESEQALPTLSSEIIHDLNAILYVLSESGNIRFWNVFCLKASEEFPAKKFNSEKVKDHLRRFEIPAILTRRIGDYSSELSLSEFWGRYSQLHPDRKKNDESDVKRAHLSSALTDNSDLEAKCKAIYEMYAIVTGGGNGLITVEDDTIYMNERSWWALERNLFAIEIEKRMKNLSSNRLPQDTEQADSDSEVLYDDSDPSSDFQKDGDIKEREARMKAMTDEQKSSQRILWMRTTTFLTWWIPTFAIRKIGGMNVPEVIQAWREKVALFILIMLLTGMMLFVIAGFGPLICPKQDLFTVEEMNLRSTERLIGVHGNVYSLVNLSPSHDEIVNNYWNYISRDVSYLFPLKQTFECSSLKSSLVRRQINFETGNIDSTNTTAPPSSASSDKTCSDNGNPKRCHSISLPQELGSRVNGAVNMGKMAFVETEIRKHGSIDDAWVVIDGKIYDITNALKNGVFPQDDLSIFTSNLGLGPKASQANTVSSATQQCLELEYFVGFVDTRNNLQCMISENTLLALTAILCSVMFVKFLAALQLGALRRPEEQVRYTIIQIPCYTEGEESLKKTINSCAMLDYEDDKKLMFIIADGLIKGSGNDRMTPEIVLDILGVENSHERLTSDVEIQRHDYVALGDGMNRLNKAKVFSGIYSYLTHNIPFVVVVKCGKESEMRRPGNRGKRDSQLIVMNFLNKVFYQRPMQPLEYEIYRHMKYRIGIPPEAYEFCLMVDADTEVLEDSLNRLIAVMAHDSKIMGLCGETTIGNEQDSWVTMIQGMFSQKC